MANNIGQTTLVGSGKDKNIIRRITIISDGSEETALNIYDNSAFINDVTKGCLMEVWALGSDCICRLFWDTTADVTTVQLNPGSNKHLCFRSFGGLSNPGGAGATGDLMLTTANLDAGDEVTLILWITQN